MSISIDNIAREVIRNFEGYTERVRQGIDEEREAIAERAASMINAESPVRTGRYQKSWKTKEGKFQGQNNKSILYNKKHYQRTHLLENGHYTRNGGWTQVRVHIKPVEDMVREEFIQAAERVIQNG